MNWMLIQMTDEKRRARFSLQEIQRVLKKTGKQAIVGYEPEEPDPTMPTGFVSWRFLIKINILDLYDRTKRFLKKK